jgi:hypothetical protein
VSLLAVTVKALAREPDALATSDARLIPPAVVVLIVLYATGVVWALRRPGPGDVTGTLVGLLAGALWSVEIFAGGPALLPGSTEVVVGATFAISAAVLTLAAGPFTVLRDVLRVPAGARVFSPVWSADWWCSTSRA